MRKFDADETLTSHSHSRFKTPAGGGFGTPAIDADGIANIIVSLGTPQLGAAPVAGWLGLAGLATVLLTCGLYGLWRLPRSA